MAGSVFRPLTNIPYCCLPQESGPCLSTSVGDRPLRSPTHRRLGGPSPRLLSNGTHARPPPRLRLATGKMPPQRRIRCYPAFPPAIPVRGVGCIRVTHPSATLMPPKGHLPSDLHVLGLPLAFILSQDQTLRCNIVLLVSVLNLGFRLRSLVFLFPCPPPVCTTDADRFLVLASSFQRTFRFPFPFKSTPLFCGSGLQRYDLFGNWQSKKSIIFDKILYYFENQLNKILIFYKKT